MKGRRRARSICRRGAHGNERTFSIRAWDWIRIEVITAIDSRHVDECGAYPRYEPLGCLFGRRCCRGRIASRTCAIDMNQVVTNKCPVGPNRGYSRMQQLWFMERVLDICGHTLGIPTDEMRGSGITSVKRKCLIPRRTGAYTTLATTRGMLALGKKLIGWDEWKKKTGGGAQGRPVGSASGLGRRWTRATNNLGRRRLSIISLRFQGSPKRRIPNLIFMARGGQSRIGTGRDKDTRRLRRRCVADVLGISPDLVKVKPGFDTEQNVYTGHRGLMRASLR